MPIRHAQQRDLSEIVRIYNETVSSRMVTADLEPVTVESRLEWFLAHNPESFPLWVDEEDKKIRGWLSLNQFYERAGYRKTAELSLYVESSCRNQGVGSILLQHAVEAAPLIGLSTLLGFIFAHNHPSLALFERFGFLTWGKLPGVAELDGSRVDVIIMGRSV